MSRIDSFPLPAILLSEDIPVSAAMIEIGLSVLEETDDRPISRLTIERAFQEMYLCGFRESVSASSDP